LGIRFLFGYVEEGLPMDEHSLIRFAEGRPAGAPGSRAPARLDYWIWPGQISGWDHR
jgi:hypothetical protein